MLKPLAVLIILIVSGCQSTPPSPDTTGKISKNQALQLPDLQQTQSYKNALQLLNQKEFKQAEQILLELSKEIPGFSGSWVNLGLLKLLNKDPVTAKSYVTQALKLAPNLAQAHNLMGLIATHDRDIKLAEGYYIEAIRLNSQYANAHYNLALLYDVYLQDTRLAVKHYQQYLAHINNEDSTTQGWVKQLQSALNH